MKVYIDTYKLNKDELQPTQIILAIDLNLTLRRLFILFLSGQYSTTAISYLNP